MFNDEIQPASIEQLVRGRNGKMIAIDADVGGIVQQIQEINPAFHVRYSEAGEYWVVFRINPDTKKQELVTTAQELDGRLLNRIRKISSPLYDFAAEVDKLEAQGKKAKEYQWSEQVREHGEQLAHALRKDKGLHKDSARSKRRWAAK